MEKPCISRSRAVVLAENIQITEGVDLASAGLRFFAARGQTLGEVNIVQLVTFDEGVRLPVMTVTLEGATVESIRSQADTDRRMTGTVSLGFDKIC